MPAITSHRPHDDDSLPERVGRYQFRGMVFRQHDEEKGAGLEELSWPPPPDERPNPLDVPPYLLKLVDGHWVADLAEVLGRVKGLPSAVQESFQKYFDPAMIEDLEYLVGGLQKLRENQMPNREELMVLAGPHFTLEPLSWSFRDVAACEPIDKRMAEKIRRRISIPLLEASKDLVWTGATGEIVDWLNELSDVAQPEPH